MTEFKKFVDRRSEAEKNAELATPVLFWYDETGEGKNLRRRTNAIAVTTDNVLLVARAVCSSRDNFERKMGRRIASGRLMGRSKTHCAIMPLNSVDVANACANEYKFEFPDDDMGFKRAFNAGHVFAQALASTVLTQS